MLKRMVILGLASVTLGGVLATARPARALSYVKYVDGKEYIFPADASEHRVQRIMHAQDLRRKAEFLRAQTAFRAKLRHERAMQLRRRTEAWARAFRQHPGALRSTGSHYGGHQGHQVRQSHGGHRGYR
jgi:hypothetical protein